MTWSLFIDDERFPKTDREFVICRSVAEAQALVLEKGCPEFISFDHDLGNENDVPLPTGYDFCLWLVNMELDGKIKFPDNFTYNVHSANPIGKKNIEGLLDSYFSHR